MSELQTVSITIGILTACVSVLIGVANSIMSNRRAEKQRQTNLFMGLYDRFNDIDFAKQWATLRLLDYEWNSYDEFIQKYSARTNLEVANAMTSVGRYFEGLGVLVEKRLIDIDLVTSLLYQYITWYWEKHETIIKEYRKQHNEPLTYDHIESLYNELKKRQQQATPST